MTQAAPTTSSVFDGRVPFPDFISVETTMKCNLRCPMCLPYLEGTTVLGNHMDPDDFEHIAQAMFPYIDRFQLTVSGEPLMSKGLARMLQLAEEYGVRAEYYTNGTLLNDRMISMILPTLGEISISFDGATKETFDYMREGATFEHVLRNVERLVAAIKKVPEPIRPSVGFAVTVMEKNIRELPALVELAHRLGIDFVSVAHVFPVIAEMQKQSLAHYVDLAKEWIGKALARGTELGIPVSIQPLDQVIVAMAETERPSGTTSRAIALKDGGVEGLEAKSVLYDRRRPRPAPPVVTESAQYHVGERAAKRARADVIETPAPSERGAMPESIWFCDFLWNRMYVTTEGTVRPCCVPGVPEIGNFRSGGESVWDNEAYRAMRIGLVRQEPVPVCRGCQHIKVVTDPAEVERLLNGRTLPPPVDLPPVLRPVVDAENVAIFGTIGEPLGCAVPPTIEWPELAEADGYDFESFTTAGNKRIRYDTEPRGIKLTEPRLPIPAYLWSEAPRGSLIQWQAIARLPRARVVVARGAFIRMEPADLPTFGHDAAPLREPVSSVESPFVSWNPAPDASGYEFQASLDDFATVKYTTCEVNEFLPDPAFQIPAEAWAKVPPGAPLAWRGLAVFPDRRQVLARGVFVRPDAAD